MNKKIDAMLEEYRVNGYVVDVMVDKPIIYVVVAIGELFGVGIMRCRPDEEFNPREYVKHAFRRALKHIADQYALTKTFNVSYADFDYSEAIRIIDRYANLDYGEATSVIGKRACVSQDAPQSVSRLCEDDCVAEGRPVNYVGSRWIVRCGSAGGYKDFFLDEILTVSNQYITDCGSVFLKFDNGNFGTLEDLQENYEKIIDEA